ncbi:MAG: archease [bacterium]
MGRFKILEHTADGLVEVQADTVIDLLKTGAIAMFSLMVDISKVKHRIKRELRVKGRDISDLLMNFIKELIFLYSTKGELYSEFYITMEKECDETIVNATCFGETIDPSRHYLSGEVKMLTYHRYKIEQRANGSFIATMLFDM